MPPSFGLLFPENIINCSFSPATSEMEKKIKRYPDHRLSRYLNGELGLGTGASAVSSIGVTTELEDLVVWQLEDSLELLSNVGEDLATLLWCSALATGSISIATAWNALANCSGPYTDTVESLSYVDDNTHDFSIILGLESLSNGREKHVEPDLVDWDTSLVLELVGPLSTVLVLFDLSAPLPRYGCCFSYLSILPLWSYTLLEQMVVGLQSKLGCWCNVVENTFMLLVKCAHLLVKTQLTPEFLNTSDGNDFLQEGIPSLSCTTNQPISCLLM